MVKSLRSSKLKLPRTLQRRLAESTSERPGRKVTSLFQSLAPLNSTQGKSNRVEGLYHTLPQAQHVGILADHERHGPDQCLSWVNLVDSTMSPYVR